MLIMAANKLANLRVQRFDQINYRQLYVNVLTHKQTHLYRRIDWMDAHSIPINGVLFFFFSHLHRNVAFDLFNVDFSIISYVFVYCFCHAMMSSMHPAQMMMAFY